ncbi:unnamed protein product [Camellia sinensis]
MYLPPVAKSMKTYTIVWLTPDHKRATRVDSNGNANPTWNDKFVFKVNNNLLTSDTTAVIVEIYIVSWIRDNLVGTVRVLITNLLPPNYRTVNDSVTRFVALQITRMNTDSLRRAIGAISVQGFGNDFRYCNGIGNSDVRLFSKALRINSRLLRNGIFSSTRFTIKASPIHSANVDPIVASSHGTADDPGKISNESTLILIRHGESLWNEMNLFSGCVDVPLTKKGIEEAIEAGKRISYIPVDIIFTSALVRAQMTAMLALTQHRCNKMALYLIVALAMYFYSRKDLLEAFIERLEKFGGLATLNSLKVPIIIHDESEESKMWSQIHSEETKKQSIPVVKAWQLNERMYGELQGLNKQETAEKYGKQKVHEWRRSYGTCPPNGESLQMCSQRAVAYFRKHIEPQLFAGKHVMVAAHANSLRAIIMYLDKLTTQEVINLELSNGVPMLYIYKEGKFIRRGSPLGSTEAGVYAYTWVIWPFIGIN